MIVATASPRSPTIFFRLVAGRQPLILLPVHVNGIGPFDFILDTGIPPITGGGGSIQASAARLRSFQVGGARADNFSVVVADFFGNLCHAVGAKLEGIVGYNFLRNYKVVIDYPGKMLSLF